MAEAHSLSPSKISPKRWSTRMAVTGISCLLTPLYKFLDPLLVQHFFFHFKNTYLTVPGGHVTFQYSMFSLEGPAEYPVNGVTTSPSVHDLFTFKLRLHSRLVSKSFIFLVTIPTIPTAMLKFINYI